MRPLPSLVAVVLLGLAAPLRAAGIEAARPSVPEVEPPLPLGSELVAVPAAPAPGVAARVRALAEPGTPISFRDAHLETFAGHTRLALAGELTLSWHDGVVAVDPDLVIHDVEDGLGRRPGAWRLHAAARFPEPLEFRKDEERVAVSADQGTLPGGLRPPVRVSGYAEVLRALEVASAELPAAPTEGAVELAPGLRVHVQAVGPSPVRFGLWDVEGRWWRHGVSTENDYATPFVRSIVLVDDAGREHRRSPWPMALESGHGVQSSFRASYQLPRGVKPASLRFEVVERARAEKLPFAVDLKAARD